VAFEEEPIHVSSHRLAVDTISVCLLAVLSACPASENPPTPNLRPCINHWAWRTESQRWVGGGRGGETKPTVLLFHLRLFGQKEREKENEIARHQKAGKKT